MEINFKNVSFFYNYKLSNEKKALDNINLKLEKNKIHGIIGPIGSGKSTLLELMNGITKPQQGEITIGKYHLNNNLNFNKFRYDVGLVYQFPEQQFFCSTVAEEISFAQKVFEPRNKNIKSKVIKALKIVGLNESYLKRNPFNLNGGEKRKVAIASVLISNPKVLILDEPTIGLDNKSRNSLIRLLKNLKEKYDKTIILVTHDVDLLYELVDNVVVLNNGNIIKEGTKEEVFSDVEFLDKNNTPVPSIVRFERMVYDKYKIDLGMVYNVNDLVRSISNSLKKEGDYNE